MRQHGAAILATLVVLALGWFGYDRWFGAGKGAELILLDVGGEVLVSRPGEAPVPATSGTEVRARDGVAVGEGGHAVLTIGAETRLTLGELSSIRVLEVSADGVRVELEEGRVSARVRPGSPSVSVASQGRVFSTSDGEFQAVVEEDGGLGVLALSGEVGVTGVEGANHLGQGNQLVSVPGAPAALSPVSSSLLLQVDWPASGPVRQDRVVIEGRTGPYARVNVANGRDSVGARADAQGVFQVDVPLAEGQNPLEVRATDMMGLEGSASGAVQRDTSAPAATSASVLWRR